MSEAVKRQYDSTWRQEQARETRQRIIRAAHHLFVSTGYGSTTIADIARAAGVAVETVYAAFRTSTPCCVRSGTSASAATKRTFDFGIGRRSVR